MATFVNARVTVIWMGHSYEIRNKTQTSEMMLKDKFCKLEGRIFLIESRKLFCEVNMNIRSTILRVCLIQSLIPSWIRL
jgi:hypothetical protein